MDPAEVSAAIVFGRFSVLPHRRELLAEGRPLELGGRAFDVLMVLIEASGAVISKDALMTRVWPDRIIEDNSLQHQISALRRAFGADRDLIRTISGRGYQFTGQIRPIFERPKAQAVAETQQPTPAPSLPPTNLPEPVSRLIGRDVELDEIRNLSASHRLVTLTGAGGIGKTRLGFEIARHLLPRFADGVWAVELAPLSDPELVPVTLATALGLELASGTASPLSVANALRSMQIMLVLDNCEHVVDAAARIAEALLRANPEARVIATSREPLRVEGEQIYPVQPLAVPAEDTEDGEDSLRYGAVLLFVERARAAAPRFFSDARMGAAIAGICRRLDGIPLGIELAAARAAALGIEGLATGLDDRFRLLTSGRRTALPRHQTMRATLDWSYELLTDLERVVLRYVAVFAGAFSLEAAGAVAAGAELAASDVTEGLVGLVAKSLVGAEGEGAVARYRLLHTTRAYALEKLEENNSECERILHDHAEYYRHLFERAEVEWETRPTVQWLNDYNWCVDNLRTALDWAFSSGGDASIGVALTAAAVPLWMQLSLLDECRGRADQALAILSDGASPDTPREMKLHAALAVSLRYTKGTVPEAEAAYRKALELAERLGDTEHQLHSLGELWVFHISGGQYSAALALAQKFCTLAASRSDRGDQLIGERLIGVSQHYVGDLKNARRHLERVLADEVIFGRRHLIRFQLDPRVASRVYLARILWLQGFPDQAMRTAESCVQATRAANHAFSFCHTLALGACAIALLIGDVAAAESYAGMLFDHSTRHALAYWRSFGRCYQGAVAIKRGDLDAGLALLRAGIYELGGFTSILQLNAFLMVDALGRAGQITDGLAVVEGEIARFEETEGRWPIAELLRLKGELLLLEGATSAPAVAEDHFRQALDYARQQGALSWELRAATSLARLLNVQDRSADATVVLKPVYDRFTEGFATGDLQVAKALLNDLS
jgi:predicted ATPase/DNA-binding winged helix-turn-helix (wHTH) protein